jgi:hypothetical protein
VSIVPLLRSQLSSPGLFTHPMKRLLLVLSPLALTQIKLFAWTNGELGRSAGVIGEYCSNSYQNDFRYSRGSPIQTAIRNTSKIFDLFKEHKIVRPAMPNLIMTTPNSQKLASLAKDLTKDYLRSPRDLLAGYIIAGRTLDKCRAFLNNSIGEYHFDCPLDNMFFGFAGITSEQFKECLQASKTRRSPPGSCSTLSRENGSRSLSGITIFVTSAFRSCRIESRNSWKIISRNWYQHISAII